jgi:hypothetical protein
LRPQPQLTPLHPARRKLVLQPSERIALVVLVGERVRAPVLDLAGKVIDLADELGIHLSKREMPFGFRLHWLLHSAVCCLPKIVRSGPGHEW